MAKKDNPTAIGEIEYRPARYFLIPTEGFPEDQAPDPIDLRLIELGENSGLGSDYVRHSYHFIARGRICKVFLFGQCSGGGATDAFNGVHAVKVGHWIFYAVPNKRANAKPGEYCISAYLSRLHMNFVIVDACEAASDAMGPMKLLINFLVAAIGDLIRVPPTVVSTSEDKDATKENKEEEAEAEEDKRPVSNLMPVDLKEPVLYDFIYKTPVLVARPEAVTNEKEAVVDNPTDSA